LIIRYLQFYNFEKVIDIGQILW